MLKIFTFKEKMNLGRNFYWKADFLKAQTYFEEAQLIFPDDFRANFWLARVLLIPGENSPALHQPHVCRSLRPDLGEELIDEWINIAFDKETSKVSEINEKTDATLDALSLRKNIRFLDIISFPFWLLLIGVLLKTVVVNIVHAELTIIWTDTIRNGLYLLVLSPLFYRRTVLSEIFLNAIRTRIKKLKNFHKDKYFCWWAGGVAVESMLIIASVSFQPSGNVNAAESLINSGEWYPLMIDNVILAPIVIGILTLGLTFNYIKRYSRFIAYIVSITLQVIFYLRVKDLAFAINWIGVFFIVLYTFLYEKTGSLSVVTGLRIIGGLTLAATMLMSIMSLRSG